MAKSGEIDYLRNLDEAGVLHAVHKPFSDPGRARYLAEVAAVFALLPPPPARLLDLGCGTGWTSVFFARAGYDVLGVDIAPDMVVHARANGSRAGLDRLHFLVCDYEDLPFDGEFDGAVFYDALHHAVDEAAALRGAYQALRPGGVCVTSEPGEGHHQSPEARAAVARYNVTEKEMPPRRILELGRAAGFRHGRVYPHAFDLHHGLYRRDPEGAAPSHRRPLWLKRLLYWPVAKLLGLAPGVFATRMGALGYVKHLANLLRDAERVGGIVLLEK
ncbi:MAG: class I SAM-dependent methyltransferase [Gemmataceae bacterium]|nr:class I SAM-dependent methyltransferase [Gemmataceae bacterium]